VTSKNCPLAELLQLGDSLNQNREVQHGFVIDASIRTIPVDIGQLDRP
jgi:hypothetical protein